MEKTSGCRRVLVAVAPNGARRGRKDHPQLPITATEIAKTAVSCAEAGAGMMHLHVRDEGGGHSLDPHLYRTALKEIKAAVGDSMLLQVSSEAAGIFQRQHQIECMKRLAPHCLSCGLSEFMPSEQKYEEGSAFFRELHGAGALIQYILYSPEEARLFTQLCREGFLPGSHHFLLFVFGRYGRKKQLQPASVAPYLTPLESGAFSYTWMVCGFDAQEHQVVEEALNYGGHVRIGFENNLLGRDGSPYHSNSDRVKEVCGLVKGLGLEVGGRSFAESLYLGSAVL